MNSSSIYYLIATAITVRRSPPNIVLPLSCARRSELQLLLRKIGYAGVRPRIFIAGTKDAPAINLAVFSRPRRLLGSIVKRANVSAARRLFLMRVVNCRARRRYRSTGAGYGRAEKKRSREEAPLHKEAERRRSPAEMGKEGWRLRGGRERERGGKIAKP